MISGISVEVGTAVGVELAVGCGVGLGAKTAGVAVTVGSRVSGITVGDSCAAMVSAAAVNTISDGIVAVEELSVEGKLHPVKIRISMISKVEINKRLHMVCFLTR